MKRTIGFAVLGLGAGAFLFPAAAQVAAPDGSGSSTGTQAPQIKGGTGESLSTKLNKTDGVISPNTNVDPGIHVPAPDPHPNSTPVIPPAATGGNSAK